MRADLGAWQKDMRGAMNNVERGDARSPWRRRWSDRSARGVGQREPSRRQGRRAEPAVQSVCALSRRRRADQRPAVALNRALFLKHCDRRSALAGGAIARPSPAMRNRSTPDPAPAIFFLLVQDFASDKRCRKSSSPGTLAGIAHYVERAGPDPGYVNLPPSTVGIGGPLIPSQQQHDRGRLLTAKRPLARPLRKVGRS